MKTAIIQVLIIDESGSMRGMESFVNETYHGFVVNTQEAIKAAPEIDQYLSVWTFEGGNIINRLTFGKVETKDVPLQLPYRPAGATPLFDAIGKVVSSTERSIEQTAEVLEATVQVNIISDGYENSSVEFSARIIADLIKTKEKGNWEFHYFGTDHDVYAVAESLNIVESRTARFSKNHNGFQHISRSISVNLNDVVAKITKPKS
jgi:uncharacterized protein YegL